MINKTIALALCGFLALTVSPAGAQVSTFSISGTVPYPDGTVVPQYVVQWNSESDKTVAGAVVTGQNGEYKIPSLASGAYLIGFFPPNFVPETEKPSLQARTDVSPELAQAGAPLSRRVVLKDASQPNVDFLILPQTGLPKVQSPEVDGAPPVLPSTGTGALSKRNVGGSERAVLAGATGLLAALFAVIAATSAAWILPRRHRR